MGWGMDVIGGLVGGTREVGNAFADGLGSAESATADDFESASKRVQDQLTPDIRPEGTDGHQIYVWFHHGPGTGSMDNAIDGWRTVAEHHVTVAEAVNSAMGKMRTSWQGQAAGSAIDASRALRDAADSASKSARQVGDALSAQSFGFNEAKKGVVDVASDRPTIDPLTGGVGMIDCHQQAQSYTADQRANQQHLRDYGAQTGANSGIVPRFDGSGPAGGSVRSADSGPPADPAASGSGAGQGPRTGMPGRASPAGTDSAFYDGDGGLPQGGGFDYSTSHGISGGGIAAGVAGLAAGGTAVLGGGVLGDHSGRGGISGRRVAGFSTGSGSGAGAGVTTSGGSATTPRAGATGRGQQGEDEEQHEHPEWLTAEESPDELFGTDERTAPPVLGALPSEQDTGS